MGVSYITYMHVRKANVTLYIELAEYIYTFTHISEEIVLPDLYKLSKRIV